MCVHPEVSKEGDRERVDEPMGLDTSTDLLGRHHKQTAWQTGVTSVQAEDVSRADGTMGTGEEARSLHALREVPRLQHSRAVACAHGRRSTCSVLTTSGTRLHLPTSLSFLKQACLSMQNLGSWWGQNKA